MDEATQFYQINFNDIAPGVIPEEVNASAVRDNEGVQKDEEFIIPEDAQVLVEPLAKYAHDAWTGWMDWVFMYAPFNPDGSFTIPAAQVKRWKGLMYTPYDQLGEQEKDADREEARAIIKVLYETLR